MAAPRLRITGGAWRGRRLRVPPGVRPTQERVREALYSHLGDRLVDAVGLDLFAGSGALGLEALSRGARWIGFVERAPEVVRVARRNLTDLGIGGERAEVVRAELPAALSGLAPRWPRSFDLVLADPPYRFDRLDRLVELAVSRLRAEGLLVVEHERGARFAVPRGTELASVRRYGDTELSLVRVTSRGASRTDERASRC